MDLDLDSTQPRFKKKKKTIVTAPVLSAGTDRHITCASLVELWELILIKQTIDELKHLQTICKRKTNKVNRCFGKGFYDIGWYRVWRVKANLIRQREKNQMTRFSFVTVSRVQKSTTFLFFVWRRWEHGGSRGLVRCLGVVRAASPGEQAAGPIS